MVRLRQPSQPIWYSIMAGVASIIALVIGGAFYVENRIDQNNQQLCAVIAASLGLDGDPNTPLPPASNPRSAKIVQEMTNLYLAFDCERLGSPPIYK